MPNRSVPWLSCALSWPSFVSLTCFAPFRIYSRLLFGEKTSVMAGSFGEEALLRCGLMQNESSQVRISDRCSYDVLFSLLFSAPRADDWRTCKHAEAPAKIRPARISTTTPSARIRFANSSKVMASSLL